MTIEAVDLERSGPRGGVRPKGEMRDPVQGRFAYRDAWFPVAFSEHVAKRPIRRLIHSQPYFLWREDGQPKAAEFHPSEFAAMRKHASAFTGGSGEYPVTERYGYVWVWYGDPAAADVALVPCVPYLPNAGGLPWYMKGINRFDCCTELSLENLIDLTHADFLHGNVVGDEISDDDQIEVVSTSETVTMIRTCKNKSVAPIMKMAGVKTDKQDVCAVIHIHLRNGVALTTGNYEPGFKVQLFHPCVPESQYRNYLPYTFNTSGMSAPFRWMMPQSSYLISRQDNSMVRLQAPRYAHSTDRRDLHSRFDAAGVKYRFLLAELAERQKKGDYSYLSDGDPGRDVTDLMGCNRVN